MTTVAFWLRYAVRSIRRGGRRSLFALLCVAVGVAGVVALETASLTVQTALTSNVRAANGGDIALSSAEAPLSAGDLAVFRQLQQAGRIAGWTAVSSLHATAVGTKRQLVPFDVNVVDVRQYPLGGQPTFVSPGNGNVGRLMRNPGDVLVTAVLADELGAGVGSRLFVHGLGGVGLHVTVQGVLAETSFEHSAIMTVQRGDAGSLTNRSPTYSAVYANLGGRTAGPITALLRQNFPLATVSTVQDALQSAQVQVHDFRQFLLLVALFALLIAGVGILNAMQSILAWRRMEIAMLKAVGFGHTTLYMLFGLEAVLLGTLGGVTGTVLGALASKTISDALARAMAIQVVFQLDPGTLLGGVGLGVGATVIFGILPIVRAASFRPIEILRDGGTPPSSGFVQTLALLAVVLFLFGALAALIVGDTTVAIEFALGAFAASAVLSGGFALVVGWVGRLGRPSSLASGWIVFAALAALIALTVRFAQSLIGITVFLFVVWTLTLVVPERRLLALLVAVRSLSRRRARAAVTLVAFLAGVLAMTVTLTVAVSLRNQINQAIASRGKVNLVAIGDVSAGRDVLAASSRLPGVKSAALTTLATTQATGINGRPLAQVVPIPANGEQDNEDRTRFFAGITGYPLRAGMKPTGIRIVVGRNLAARDAGTNRVLVRSPLLGPPFNLRLGDRIQIKSSSSRIQRVVRVVGFYSRPRSVRGFGSFFTAPILSDRALPVVVGGTDAQSVVNFVVDKQHLTADAAAVQQAVPGALVIDIGDLTAVVETILNELLNLLAVITALVLGAGLAVVANGVTLAMFERRREIALYKAVGFNPAAVLRFVLVENALIGSLAGAASVLAAALALGLLSRLALQQAVGFDPLLAVYVLVGATVLAIVTAYVAARGPVRIRPLEALRND